jgi:hypothetical protein
VSERVGNEQNDVEGPLRCPTCGTPYHAGDRFCAQCGAALAAASPPPPTAAESTPATAPARRDDAIWLFAAPPRTVIGGGVLLLLLAVALLAIGQLDDTGTIVMASICLAPLALLTVAIGVVRGIAR